MMTYNQILSDLNKKVYYPVYFLSGEEPYYIDKIAEYIELNVLNDIEKEFNLTVLYGEETDVHTLINCAKRYPMMTNYQVVIVKEAHNIDKIEELENYIITPLKSTILVICYKYKKLDKRKSFTKNITTKTVFFESTKIRDNKLSEWITNYVNEKKCRISLLAANNLCEYIGNDLSKIVNEIDKIMISLPENSEISQQTILENIGMSKDYNIFELINAITKKDIYKANIIINYFEANPKENSIIKNIIFIYNFFNKLLIYHFLKDKSKINEVASALSVSYNFVNDYINAAKFYNIDKSIKIISLLREYDLKAKGVDNVSTSHPELMKELVFRIMH